MDDCKLLTCIDCGADLTKRFARPFSNGDGKIRCASCAVDKYMKAPGSQIRLKKGTFYKGPAT